MQCNIKSSLDSTWNLCTTHATAWPNEAGFGCPQAPRDDALVESARASGREVLIVTYRDGKTPVDSRLLFRDPEEARECARVLTEAIKPPRAR
jgi:hypothetical protein